MAFADGAVELGPRNRRWLAKGTISLAMIGALVAAVLLTRPPSHTVATGGAVLSPSAPAPKLTFGMTKQQVERLTGKPATVQGRCWFFRPQSGMVGSIALGVNQAAADTSARSLRLCFDGNVYSDSADFERLKGHWVWTGWPVVTEPRPAG